MRALIVMIKCPSCVFQEEHFFGQFVRWPHRGQEYFSKDIFPNRKNVRFSGKMSDVYFPNNRSPPPPPPLYNPGIYA